MRIRRIHRTHFAPLSDITAEAIVSDRDYIPKVIGAAPAICFQFDHMENEASIRRIIEDHHAPVLAQSYQDWQIEASTYRKPRSAKQIAAGRRWTARINDDGDKIHGYDDGECHIPDVRPAGYWA